MILAAIFVSLTSTHVRSLDSADRPMLRRHPTLSKTPIAFAFAGDIWSVARRGGVAVRLTSSPGVESDPGSHRMGR